MTCLQNQVHIKKIILLSANDLVTQQSVIDMVPKLKQQLPDVSFGAGTDYNFTELNN